MERGTILRVARITLIDVGVLLVAYAALLGFERHSWNPVSSSLSKLGVLPETATIFNSGVALASIGLSLYAICSVAWLVAAAALSQVAVYTLSHPYGHFAAAAVFFTASLVELLRSAGGIEKLAAVAGYAGILSGLFFHMPPGIAVPEALLVAAILSYLHRKAGCGFYRERGV